jgi:hypothetical protein
MKRRNPFSAPIPVDMHKEEKKRKSHQSESLSEKKNSDYNAVAVNRG